MSRLTSGAAIAYSSATAGVHTGGYRLRNTRLSIAAALLATASGCDLTRTAAHATADIFDRAAPAIEAHWDYELVGDALPASILQLEGLFRIAPDDERLGLQLVRAYTSYAFGWVEESAHDAAAGGALEQEERRLARAVRLYRRAQKVGLYLLKRRHPGLERARRQGAEPFVRWLREHTRAGDDVPLLFWDGLRLGPGY